MGVLFVQGIALFLIVIVVSRGWRCLAKTPKRMECIRALALSHTAAWWCTSLIAVQRGFKPVWDKPQISMETQGLPKPGLKWSQAHTQSWPLSNVFRLLYPIPLMQARAGYFSGMPHCVVWNDLVAFRSSCAAQMSVSNEQWGKE